MLLNYESKLNLKTQIFKKHILLPQILFLIPNPYTLMRITNVRFYKNRRLKYIFILIFGLFLLSTNYTYSQDTDGDGIANSVDIDDDNDGILDINECQSTTIPAGAIPTNTGAAITFNSDVDRQERILTNNNDGAEFNTTGTSGSILVVAFGRSLPVGTTVIIEADRDNGTDFATFRIQQANTANGSDASNPLIISSLTTSFVNYNYTISGTSATHLRISLDAIEAGGEAEIDHIRWNSITGCLDFDIDGDGIINRLDLDSDGDGITDNVEAQTTAGFTAPTGTDTDNDGLDDAYDATPTTGASGSIGINPTNSDTDSLLDFTDIDADNDGIPDNVEAQSTLGYVTPTGNVGVNGLDSAYENIDTFSPAAITLVNTDGADLPDFRDTDSDNDNTNDLNENGEGNILSGSDLDGDGLDNNFDQNNASYDVNDNINTPSTDLPDTDTDVNTGGDVDFRDAINGLDSDGDTIPDAVDIDDDNDGILDSNECQNTTIPAGAIPTSTGAAITFNSDVDRQERILTNNNDGAEFNTTGPSGSILVVAFGRSLPVGTTVIIEADRDSGTDFATFRIQQANTANGSDASNPLTISSLTTSFINYNYTISGTSATHLRISLDAIESGGEAEVDHVRWNSITGCVDFDTDGDGIINRLDLDSDNDGITDNLEGQTTVGFTAPTGTDTDNDGLDDAYDATPTTGASGSIGINPTNSDTDSLSDFIDIDVDNDGIPDNIEAQSTLGYTAPNGVPGNNGLDSAYDFTDLYISTGLNTSLVNTDGDAEPDFRDTDSDGDGTNDNVEGRTGSPTFTGSDTDGDGLDNGYDTVNTTGSAFDVNDNISNPATGGLIDLDSDVNIGGNVDYRDNLIGVDTDGDGVINSVDIDDDNDGILDTVECNEISISAGIANAITLDQGVSHENRILTQNDDGAEFNNINDVLVVALGVEIPIGTVLTMRVQKDNNDDKTLQFEQSDASGNNRTNPVSTGDLNDDNVWRDFSYIVTGSPATHIRISMLVENGGGRAEVGYISYPAITLCSDFDRDGIPNTLDLDSDNDGILDIIESQPSTGPTVPSGADSDNDGLNNAFDATPTTGATGSNGITPIITIATDITPDYLDIDTDDDGIPDNVEFQTTKGYTPPSGTVGRNGVDFNYENNDTFIAIGQNPVNFDGTDQPDYRDTNSDNDAILDANESGITLNIGTLGTDSDGDGLDDIYEGSNATSSETYDVNDQINNPLTDLLDIDNDANALGDVDYRDISSFLDTDMDGIANDVDVDDDNDGILDTDECNEITISAGIANAITLDQGVSQETRILTQNDDGAEFNNINDVLVVALGVEIPIGTVLTMRIWKDNNNDKTLQFEQSDASGNNRTNPVSTGDLNDDNVWRDFSYTVTGSPATHIRISMLVENGSGRAEVGYISYPAISGCSDADGDGILNALDIDSDNDGIPDNIEAQSTLGYIAPSGSGAGITDVDMDGLDDVYDPNCTPCVTNGTAITPVNTDNITGNNTDTTPDYLDADSDGDGLNDILENGNANVASGIDTDGDGLDDAFEGVVTDNDVNDNINNPLTDLPDIDTDASTPGSNTPAADYNDVDYRDIDDDRMPITAGRILWVRSDRGASGSTTLTGWTDQTNTGIVNTINGNPTINQFINFNPTVTFDGNGDYITTNLNINSNTYPDISVFAVYTPAVNSAGGVWGEDDGAWDRFILDGNTTTLNNLVANGSGPTLNIPNIFPVGNTVVTTVTFDEDTTNGAFVYANGLQSANFTPNHGPETSNVLQIGAIGKNDFHFNGSISEIIVFGSVLTPIHRQSVESYLATKSGVTLESTNNNGTIVEGDYLLNDQTTKVWGFTANSAYHNDVAGIVRDDDILLYQKQSRSINSDAIITIGLGDIVANNASNINSINANKSALMWGNNNANLATITSSALLCETENQMNRVWKIVETGTVGTVEIAAVKATVDNALNETSVILLKVADDANFTTNVKHIPVATRTVNGTVSYVADFDFNGTKYFTYSDILGIFWNGDANAWTGGAGTSNAPTIDPSADGTKILVIDAETSGRNAIMTASANVECVWVKPNSKLVINSDLFLEFNQDFLLEGEIRLIGDAQLVQSHTGSTNVQGSGTIYRDQATNVPSVYRYSYWSSPVVAALGNTSYTVGSVMKDGTTPTSENSTIKEINFIGYTGDFSTLNGAPTDPITIANHWIFSYYNGFTRNDWVRELNTETIDIGEGFIMKSTGRSPQNFTFVGSPNDGIITKVLVPGTSSLLGNPYPSVLNTQQFITDNDNVIDGTLYFWEHQGESSTTTIVEGHDRFGYIGGYSQRNQAMGVAANSVVNGTAGLGEGVYRSPPQFIAVGQGFFVGTPADKGGTLTFQNSQRTANTNNVFFRSSSEDDENLPNFKLGMEYVSDTNTEIHRQLGINFKEGNTFDYESGFDSQVFDLQPTDMFWDFEEIESNLIIAGVGEINADLQIPLGFTIDSDFPINIMLDEKENMEGYTIYLGDLMTGRLYNLEDPVELNLPKGNYSNRFVLMFGGTALSTDDNPLLQGLNLFRNNTTDEIIIRNNNSSTFKKIEVFNILGQQIKLWKNFTNTTEERFYFNPPSAIYIVKVTTNKGEITKKILID